MHRPSVVDKKSAAAPAAASNERAPPTAALKRFVQRLDETSYGQRYLQINKDRVANFLTKSDVEPKEVYNEKLEKKSVKQVEDPYIPPNYCEGLKLQQHPEFQKELGVRSRFGDGDGSFFDLWLSSGGEYCSKQKYDSAGLPVVSKTTKSFPQPLVGFKRQYMLRSGEPSVKEETKYSSIESYEVRRQRRLEREAKEKEEQEFEEKRKAEEQLRLNSKLAVPPEALISNPYIPSPLPFSSPPPSRQEQRFSKQVATAMEVLGVGTTVGDGSWKVTGSPPRNVSPPNGKSSSRSGRLQSLSAVEKNTYFGDDARTSFFDYYRQLSRQQHVFIDNGSDAAQTGLRVLLDERVESKPFGGGGGMGSSRKDVADAEARLEGPKRRVKLEQALDEKYGQFREKTSSPTFSNSAFSDGEESNSRTGSPLPYPIGDSPTEDMVVPPRLSTSRKSARFDEQSSSDLLSESRLDAKRRFSRRLSGNLSPLKQLMKSTAATSGKGGSKTSTDNSAVNNELLFDQLLSDINKGLTFNTLTLPVYSSNDVNSRDNAMLAIASRPLSARSKFLISCVSSHLKPDPSMVIRKEITSCLNISSKSIGNKMAQVLASGLSTMPMLEELKLADNRLTDEGLKAIIDVLSDCPRLTSLDISQNKVDSLAAQSLNQFLSDPKCKLNELHISKADVDDLEAAQIIKALSTNRNIKYIDMSSNLLGSHEIRTERIKDPTNFITGAVALGQYLMAPDCSLTTLILSWNMIRLQSCNALVQSIALNSSLTHLNLSYNSLGQEGGEALGDALHSQCSLQYLNIAHNNIQSRAAFIIMAGVRSCETLTTVDLSENPIGEVGGKAVMAATMYLGQSIHIEIKGCALRSRDPSCWFDSKKPPKDLKLNLSNRYERAVCMEMLRLIANNDDLKLTKCKYYAERNSSGQDLEFVTKRVQLTTETAIANTASSLAVDQKAELERAQRLFRQYDEDGNGTLDRHELSTLLTGLGLVGSREAVDQMLAVYDMDGAGVIEEKEFVHFLQSMQAQATKASLQVNQRSFLVLKGMENAAPPAPSPPPKSGTPSGRRSTVIPGSSATKVTSNQYIPPSVGTIEMSVKMESAASMFLQTATSGNVQSVLNATKAIADSNAMIDCALDSMSLKFEQAIVLYRIMIKEHGERNKVLLQLLPRMETPADARRLFNKTSSGDLHEKVNFKALAGKMYDAFMRIPSGYFDFNLSDESDRTILHRFVEIHKQNVFERQKLDYGDTSENGDWMINFRNVRLDGNPFVLKQEWLENFPRQGRLAFDFVPLFRTTQQDQAMSDIRLCNLLVGLGLLAEEQRLHTFARLNMLDEIGRTAAKGLGISSCEFSTKEAHDLMKQLVVLKERLPERSATIDLMAKQREHELNAIFAKLAEPVAPASATVATNRATVVIAKPPENGSDLGAARPQAPLHAVEGVPLEAYAHHLKYLNSSVDVSFDLLAASTMDALIELISGRFITIAQLSVILECFPTNPIATTVDPAVAAVAAVAEEKAPEQGTLRQKMSKYNSVAGKFKSEKHLMAASKPTHDSLCLFSSFKVELVIALFPQIIDLVNFEMIFVKLLSTAERALIYLRLGMLNVWNPLKMDGGYSLDLSDNEQRQILKVLILMAVIEPGENWLEEMYYEARGSTFTVGWELPGTWFIDSCIPQTGIVALKYFSGNGTGMNNCAPNPMARMILMSLVHAQAYAIDAHRFQKPSLTAVHELNIEFGCSMNFDRQTSDTSTTTTKPPS